MVFCKTSLATNHPPTLEAIDGGGGSPSTLSFWSFMGPWLMQWGLTFMETQEVDKTVAPCVCKVGRQSCDIEALGNLASLDVCPIPYNYRWLPQWVRSPWSQVQGQRIRRLIKKIDPVLS